MLTGPQWRLRVLHLGPSQVFFRLISSIFSDRVSGHNRRWKTETTLTFLIKLLSDLGQGLLPDHRVGTDLEIRVPSERAGSSMWIQKAGVSQSICLEGHLT